MEAETDEAIEEPNEGGAVKIMIENWVASSESLRTTDGSSDERFLNGGLGVFITTPSDANYQVIGAGAIASCFPCVLRTIFEALDIYETLPILELAKGLVIF
ncbi:hypothetical protein TNCV_501021 [Trichonephila clavipes]|nr:hypothetical protein TNCV_501021 [Trichonephila clavipes]